MTHKNSADCYSTVQWSGITVFPRPNAKVWKLYSVEPSVLSPVTVGMPYIFALSYTQIPSLHSRREDANKRFFSFPSLTVPLAFFPCTSTKR